MINCPNCQRELDQDLAELPAGPLSLQCPNCGEVIERIALVANQMATLVQDMAKELQDRRLFTVTGISLIVDGQPVPIAGLDLNNAFAVEGNTIRNTRPISIRIPRNDTIPRSPENAILLSSEAIAVVRRIGELMNAAAINTGDDSEAICSITFDSELIGQIANLSREMSAEIEEYTVRSLIRRCAAALRCPADELGVQVAGSWNMEVYIFTVKRRREPPVECNCRGCQTRQFLNRNFIGSRGGELQ